VRMRKSACAGVEAGETAVEDTKIVCDPTLEIGVDAVKEVEESSDHRSAMFVKASVPSLTSSCAADVTMGRKAAVIVTVVLPADVALDG